MKNALLRVCFSAVLVLSFVFPALPVQAQNQLECADNNVLAAVFDNGDINTTVSTAVPFNIYYYLVKPTETWVSGFEFALTLPQSNYFTLSTTYPVNALNVGTVPDYIVGFSQPIPGAPQVLLMTQSAMTVTGEPGEYFVAPTSVPSIPNTMAYATWDGGGDYPLVPMQPISDDYGLPVAQFNGGHLDYCPAQAPLDMVVNINFDGDNDNIAGTSLDATDGFDTDYDLVDANYSLTFPHPEWNQATDRFKHDIKAPYDPTLEQKQWTFVATAQAAQSDGRNVAMSFQPNFAANPSVTFELVDRNTDITYDLNTQTNLSFFVAGGSSFNHTFDLFIGNNNPVESPLWVDVAATSNGYSEPANRLSTTSLATDGYDAGLDVPEPIHPPSGYVSASFWHEDWPLGPRFRTDARALFDPTTDTKSWGLRVETDQSGTIALNFGASFSEQDNVGLQLRDLQSGQTFNLFPQLNYTFQNSGLTAYNFEIVVGAAGPPALNPTERTLTPGWALVGIPLEPAARTLDQIILNQAPGYAFMFDYQPAQGYSLLDPPTQANQNKGYWLATDTGFTWTMTGSPNLNGNTIALTPGWNLVGNPMWFPGPFEGMAIIHNGTTIPWLQAVNQGLVATGVQSYDQASGDYFNAVDLQPWQGYWIDALQPNLQLVFRWENFQNLPARLTVNKSGQPLDKRIWATDLTLWDANRQQSTITIGVDPAATAGFDPRFDMPQPPQPPSGGTVFAFSQPEWNLASGPYFTRDVRPPSDATITWHAVASLAHPGSANLVWDSSQWPDNTDFQLYLPTENRVVVMSMRSQSSVRLDIGDEPLPLVIRTPNMASDVTDTPVRSYRVGVYPNPFNPMTTISFDLPQAGKAEIRLYSVRGELINILGGENYAPGTYKVVWQGQDRGGRNVPSGSYFAKLYVDGQAMGPVTKMSLVR